MSSPSKEKAREWLIKHQARLMHEPDEWGDAKLAALLDAYAAAAVAKERRRCANIVSELGGRDCWAFTGECAAAIRERTR